MDSHSPEHQTPELLTEQDHIRNLGLNPETSFVNQRVLVVHSTDKAPFGDTEKYGASFMEAVLHDNEGVVDNDASDLNYITISDGPFKEGLSDPYTFEALKPLIGKLKEPTPPKNPGEYNGGQLRIYDPYLGDDPEDIFGAVEDMMIGLGFEGMPCDVQAIKIDPDNPRSKFYLQFTRAKMDYE